MENRELESRDTSRADERRMERLELNFYLKVILLLIWWLFVFELGSFSQYLA